MEHVSLTISKRSELEDLIRYCKETGYCSFDFETNARNVKDPLFAVTILSVSFQPGSAMVIPLGHKDSIWKKQWRRVFSRFAEEVLENPSIVKVAWNASFEHKVTQALGHSVRGRFMDAMLAKYLLDETPPNDLKSQVDILLPEFGGYDLPNQPGKKAKEEAKVGFWSNVDIEDLSEYGAMDADSALRLFIHYEKRLWDVGLYKYLRNFYGPLIPILSETMAEGVMIDRVYLADQVKSFEKKLNDLETEIYNIPYIKEYNEDLIERRVQNYIDALEEEIAYSDLTQSQIRNREEKISRLEMGEASTKKEKELFESLNFNSTNQMAELLYGDEGMGLDPQEFTETGNPSVGESALKALRGDDTTGFIQTLLNHRELTKMFSTYIKGIYENHLYPWDRIHPGYLPHGTVCVGEDTRIRTQGLGIRIGDLVPKEVGEKDISNLGIRALTHTGSYQRVLIAVNKGYKAMWEIEDSLGNSLECMPEHLLMSEKGWKTVKDIVEQDLLIASFSPPYTQNKPQTVPPSLEVVLPIKGFDGYFISNLGRVFSDKIRGGNGKRGTFKKEMEYQLVKGYRRVGLRNGLKKKFNFKVSTLVFTHFHGEIPEGFVIDHINCSKTDDYSTNLQVITNSENVRRSYDFSLKGFTFGEMNGVSKLSIPDILSIRKLYEGGGYSQLQLADMFSTSQGHVGGIIRGERWSWLNSCYIAKVKELGLRLVCDIHVENDESYITESNYINHNTGRFSSRNPSFQTMPRTTTSSEVKRQFIAPEDHFFVEIDGCIPGDVRVATTLGMERMDTINSSSSVVLKSETWRVDKAWPTGVKPIFEITTETGRVVRATHNHPFKVKGGFERLENLGPGDVIIRDRSIVSGTFLDLDESYLAGLFYGDGFYSQNLSPNRKINSYRIGFSAGFDREEYKKEILKVFPNQFIQEATPEPHAIYVQDKTLYYSWSSKYPKYSSHEMRIPEAIWLSGEESKLSFIGGAIDSDGSVNANRIRYTSVCKKYIQDLALLGDSVGVYGVIETQGKGGFKNSSVNYSWVIYSNPSVARVAPFIRLPRKKESLAQWAGAKKENKCRTEMVPWGIYKHLIAQTHEVGPYKPVKMTLRNSSRRGRLTRWAIENNIIPYMKSPLKEDWEDILNFSYEIIKSIDKRGEVKTYDMKVQWAEAFTANGFVVHNSQMELRMVAEVSGDEAMIETFKSGKNIHVQTAALISKKDYGFINKARKAEDHSDHLWAVREHKKAKVLNFTILYGAGPPTVSEFLTDATGEYHSKGDAQEMIDAWFDAYPGVRKWIKKIHKEGQRQGFVANPFGRRRRFPILLNDYNKRSKPGLWNEALRQSANAVIQGGSSDMTQWVNIQIQKERLKGNLPPSLRLVSTVHDSLEYYVHKDDLGIVIPQIIDLAKALPDLEKYMGWTMRTVEMKFSAEFGINWGTMHEYDDKIHTPEFDFSQFYKSEWEKYNLEPFKHIHRILK